MSDDYEASVAQADFFIDELADWTNVTRRPLFGASALYRGGQVFGMVWHGTLYFKVDDSTRKIYEAAKSQALPYKTKGSEDHALKSYMEVPLDLLEDQEKLVEWANAAYKAATDGDA